MFKVYTISQVIRTEPHKLKLDFVECLKREINRQFCNKVVLDVGVCVGLYDFQEIGTSRIAHTEGCTYTDVVFRLLIFRPFVGEILYGKISQCDDTGVWVSTLFFAEIFVSAENLPYPSNYSENESAWIWEYETDEGAAQLYMEKGSIVRFRVIDMTFTDVPPTESETDGDGSGPSSENKQAEPSFVLYGTMSECGLGCTSWWDSA
ncbi:DNA directed RNA polymerase III subunit RPC8 [Trichuris trichiura]|uniref:DNA directed RNA polymerase III subunit RPC8 n=1 Tax=Trichuris trichiura TaxID=36087 RepID=A0A077Z7I0_TRITR|nr:DNA directed RNA polymerase III subunit RPC8 [Trichuris trichiura]